MKRRPTLKKGDLVKLTKKSVHLRKFIGINWSSKTSLIVIDLDGDGSEFNTMVTCCVKLNGKTHHRDFLRRELWYSGFNIFEHKNVKNQSTKNKPRNNDGRTTCFICKKSTKIAGGGMYNLCNNPKCEWYKN